MKAQRPGGGRVQGRSYRRRLLAAPALTPVQPWTTPNNYTLSGYFGVHLRGQLHNLIRTNLIRTDLSGANLCTAD